MENRKIVQIILFVLLLLGCNNNANKNLAKEKRGSDLNCKNDSSLYVLTENNLLYKDSLNKLYLRVPNEIPKDWNLPLSKCQKLPYVYINEVCLLNDSISVLEKEIDIKTFFLVKGTSNYYSDRRRIYVYRIDPVGWPPFYEIKLNLNNITVVDSFTIKDNKYTYYKGLLIDN